MLRCHSGRIIEADRKGNDEACDHTGISIKRAYVTNNKQPITFKVVDEAGGSGVNLSTVKIKLDGTTYTTSSTGMVSKGITNGYQFTFTPQTALKDGSHTITINASDNDGNAAAAVSSTFTIDTVPPTLTISSPAAGLITNKAALNGQERPMMQHPVRSH